MIRQIIHIDEKKCNGCGACAKACHEGAIEIVNGKAKLIRDDYCDGMGDCLPECPAGALTFEIREAEAYSEEAVQNNKKSKSETVCPGTNVQRIERKEATAASNESGSELINWPVQIKLAPANASYYTDAKLLIAADCTAYAYANFHKDFICGKITLIGCPKLDGVDYSEKLTAILKNNEVESVEVVRMEVPCCGGLEMAVKKSILSSGKSIPCRIVTISKTGEILS